MRRPERLLVSLAVLGLAGALSGCDIPSNEPTSYEAQDALTRTNFLGGCTGADPIANGTTSTLASSPVCQCEYAVFVNNVPFNDAERGKPQYQGYSGKTFVEINNELKRDGSKFNDVVPQSVRDKLNQCKENPTSATLPASFATATTGVGGQSGAGTTVGSAAGGAPPGSAPAATSVPNGTGPGGTQT